MGSKLSTSSSRPIDDAAGIGSVLHDEEGQRIVGCLHSRRGGKKVNQDAAVINQGYGAEDGVVFSGVFDGHGKNGHLVSRLVKERLPLLLLQQKKTIAVMNETATSESSQSSCDFDNWEMAFVKAFTEMDEEIRREKRLDASFSGTTAVALLKQGEHLVIANLGDSRAILGTKHGNEVAAIQLTTDLKPGTPAEAARIRRSNGRVFALREEPELARAWLPRVCSPGMAMSRAFGDLVMKNHGIISIPVVTHHRVTSDDQFIILATDGIWDVLTNEEVVSIVGAAESEEKAAKEVVDAAVCSWKINVPNDKPDDCTAVCIFLKNDKDH